VQLRFQLRLRAARGSLESTVHAQDERALNIVNPIRITQTIHGRSYVIEVRPVSADRWRAQIARRPGGMTSLMPFYGQTPDEAARMLTSWLDRAGSRPKAV
jgi:hypothetical protein